MGSSLRVTSLSVHQAGQNQDLGRKAALDQRERGNNFRPSGPPAHPGLASQVALGAPGQRPKPGREEAAFIRNALRPEMQAPKERDLAWLLVVGSPHLSVRGVRYHTSSQLSLWIQGQMVSEKEVRLPHPHSQCDGCSTSKEILGGKGKPEAEAASVLSKPGSLGLLSCLSCLVWSVSSSTSLSTSCFPSVFKYECLPPSFQLPVYVIDFFTDFC